MATFTQDNRPMAVMTPLGKDVLLLRRFAGHEALSRLFSFELDLLSEVAPAIDFDAMLGKPVTISVKHGGHTRFVNGIVSRFAQGPNEGPFAVYRAEVVPSLWLLTRTADCRIFQKMTVPDIITKVFTGLGFTDFRLQLQGTFEPREFCVQYRETDFNFVSRLMEQYGLYYFFQHADGKHTMVIANTPSAYQPCRPEGVQFQRPTGGSPAPSQKVTDFSTAREIRAGRWSMNDYNFMTPQASLAVTATGAVPDGRLEVYDYPGEYLSKPAGEAVVKIRMEEEEMLRSVAQGASGCPQFVAGGRFKISGNSRPELDESYVLTSVTHSATEPGYGMPGGPTAFTYDNSFSCIPAAVPFRPSRTTPRPSVHGSQTAAVVGIRGEEIHTDQFGRVKVQFHWDREGRRDENSSCWIRVSHPWAGRQWGTVATPRIGQEVIVDFLEGDPDQPIITGRVYNAEQMPPYALPAGAAISGTKSNTTTGGSGFNEMSLDDTKGKERITIHAQRDMQIDAGEAITIKTGDASLTMKKDGTIILKGKNISVTGSGAINVKADGDVVLKGNKVVTN
jgi:type VI secretion system secreted protein VgrG